MDSMVDLAKFGATGLCREPFEFLAVEASRMNNQLLLHVHVIDLMPQATAMTPAPRASRTPSDLRLS
jgi:hypothetical protein